MWIFASEKIYTFRFVCLMWSNYRTQETRKRSSIERGKRDLKGEREDRTQIIKRRKGDNGEACLSG